MEKTIEKIESLKVLSECLELLVRYEGPLVSTLFDKIIKKIDEIVESL